MGHHRLSTTPVTNSGFRPRLQSAGSVPSEFAFGSGSVAPRSARKWARSAHLHEVRADGTRTGGKVKKVDGGKARAKAAKEDVDVFGMPATGGVRSQHHVIWPEGVRSSPVGGGMDVPMVEEEVKDHRGDLEDKMVEGEGWVDTDVETDSDGIEVESLKT